MNEHLDPPQIESCLDGTLSDEQEAAIQHHLDRCDACRAKFDSLAGDARDWQRISSALRSEQQAIRSSSSHSGESSSAPYYPGDYAQARSTLPSAFLNPAIAKVR